MQKKMVSESLGKSKVSIHKKVSKPLMEKKRRARINTSLDQLKTLLESLYSNNIRKRKLEKADILELTVKHLKHLQKIEKGFPVNCGVAEYHAGYTSCLASVNQYLLMSDTSTACSSTVLARLSRSLRAPGPDFSTADSDSSSAAGKRERSPVSLSNRTEICAKDRTPVNGLFHHKHADRGCCAPLQQNYWRPW